MCQPPMSRSSGPLPDHSARASRYTPRPFARSRALLQDLQNRVGFERLVAALSAEFINLSDAEIDAGIERALGQVGAFAGVDRSYVFLLSEDGARAGNTHEWCADGIAPQKDKLQDLPVDGFA